ncbi:hypothetical protein BC829DRAFT_123954 [Chytridium lagenaria]|nr:hypothetical protein BC829DRAFT_123954 [Chytridium lagenaria]
MASQRGPSTSAADPESQPFIDNTIDQDEPSPDNDFLQKAGRIELSELKRPAIFFGSIFAVIVAALLFDKAFIAGFFKAPLPDVRALSEDVFAEGMNACGRIQRVKELNPSAYFTGGPPANLAQRRNPRYPVLVNNTKAVSSGNPILIKDATVLDGIGGRFENVDVALANGLIVQIGKDLSTLDVIKAAQRGADAWNVKMSFAVDDVLVIKADGRYVTPGIVDMHSHVGADSFPTTRGTSDVNEMSSQTNPQNRIIDSINILDEGIDVVASGGVTTSLVLPGSGTLIGGEAVAIKLIKPANYEVQDMTVNRNVDETIDGKIWRWMKMACGENPKHRNNPSSRMGSGWLYRKRFEEARTTLRAQDDWCVAAKVAEARFGGDAHQYITERFPDPIVQDSLVGLLRGDVRVNIHCYETHDIEMMIRNKHEFGFQIGAFHHALEAHLVAPLLARENISVALFADHSLYKKEAYGASVKAGKILHEAGVKVAYKSDHPVLNAQHLIFEAQKAAHYGLDPDAAFASVTSVPAERLGLGWRIGTLAVGYDADVLVWDRHPLELGAAPLKVIIDGFLIQAGNRKMRAKPEAVAPSTPPMTFETNVDVLDRQPYTITNISKVFSDDGEIKKREHYC